MTKMKVKVEITLPQTKDGESLEESDYDILQYLLKVLREFETDDGLTQTFDIHFTNDLKI